MTLKSNYKLKISLAIIATMSLTVVIVSKRSKAQEPKELPLFGTDLMENIVDGEPDTRFSNESSNPLDGCYHVYLDVGTNVGIQESLWIFHHLA